MLTTARSVCNLDGRDEAGAGTSNAGILPGVILDSCEVECKESPAVRCLSRRLYVPSGISFNKLRSFLVPPPPQGGSGSPRADTRVHEGLAVGLFLPLQFCSFFRAFFPYGFLYFCSLAVLKWRYFCEVSHKTRCHGSWPFIASDNCSCWFNGDF